jgi:hypothetical protein
MFVDGVKAVFLEPSFRLILKSGGEGAMFKIKVFNALQMQFGPLKYTSLKTTLDPSKRNPKLKMNTSFEVLNKNLPTTRTNKRTKALSLQEVELDG